jgi:hypothetical protein
MKTSAVITGVFLSESPPQISHITGWKSGYEMDIKSIQTV